MMLKRLLVLMLVLLACTFSEAQENGERVSFQRFAQTMEEISAETVSSLAEKLPSLSTLEFESVPALNQVNLGELLDDMLGNLYKSHGCLHLSPRMIYVFYRLLPLGMEINIMPYGTPAPEELAKLTALDDMINFENDILNLKKTFSSARDIRAEVYPSSDLWVIYIKDQPFATVPLEAGPEKPFYLLLGRDDKGPIFENTLSEPTPAGKRFVFKKAVNYVSNAYHDTTIIQMDAQIRSYLDGYIFKDLNHKWRKVPESIAEDLRAPDQERNYTYYDIQRDAEGRIIRARFGSNTFGRYPIITSIDRQYASPILIHTSGDLMMEMRYLAYDLLQMLSSSAQNFDQAVEENPNFELYRTAYLFVQDPSRTDLLATADSAGYKAYYGMELTEEERNSLPADVFVAEKVLHVTNEVTAEENQVLVDEDLDLNKLRGIDFDIGGYAVAIKKYANYYSTLKANWGTLSNLRSAVRNDLARLGSEDRSLFRVFFRELAIRRLQLKNLTDEDARQVLKEIVNAYQ